MLTAPTMDPYTEFRPPKYTMARTSARFWIPKFPGLTYRITWANSPPQRLPRRPRKETPPSLVLRVSTVMASAAISLSRTALRAFPIVERTKLLMLHTQRTVQRNTVGRSARSGCPLKPRGPRTNSRFSIMLLTMNRNAREMMAR